MTTALPSVVVRYYSGAAVLPTIACLLAGPCSVRSVVPPRWLTGWLTGHALRTSSSSSSPSSSSTYRHAVGCVVAVATFGCWLPRCCLLGSVVMSSSSSSVVLLSWLWRCVSEALHGQRPPGLGQRDGVVQEGAQAAHEEPHPRGHDEVLGGRHERVTGLQTLEEHLRQTDRPTSHQASKPTPQLPACLPAAARPW